MSDWKGIGGWDDGAFIEVLLAHVVTRRVCRMVAGGGRSGGECHCWANNFVSYLHEIKRIMSGAIRLNGLVVEWGVILVLMTNGNGEGINGI